MWTHTPGPWEVTSGFVQTPEEIPICHMDREPGNGTLPVERDRNADLIADAPGMMQLLKAVAATYRTFRGVPKEQQEWTPLDDEILEAIQKMIHKHKEPPR
jgi:hypothetical protein